MYFRKKSRDVKGKISIEIVNLWVKLNRLIVWNYDIIVYLMGLKILLNKVNIIVNSRI